MKKAPPFYRQGWGTEALREGGVGPAPFPISKATLARVIAIAAKAGSIVESLTMPSGKHDSAPKLLVVATPGTPQELQVEPCPVFSQPVFPLRKVWHHPIDLISIRLRVIALPDVAKLVNHDCHAQVTKRVRNCNKKERRTCHRSFWLLPMIRTPKAFCDYRLRQHWVG